MFLPNSLPLNLELPFSRFVTFCDQPRKDQHRLMNTHLKMMHYVDALASAGQPLTNDDLVLYILGGLGLEYDVAINFTTRYDSLTLQEEEVVEISPSLIVDLVETFEVVAKITLAEAVVVETI
uniref:Uncharacterized protein n=1 Tax=Cannabis sativa TaxID=3483 RepID=A0A803P6H6_CANSA